MSAKNKEKYLGLDKEYEFEILWGFETDTHDILGILSKDRLSESPIFDESFLEGLRGKFNQKYPSYSSKTVHGKPLFWWAREGRLSEIEIPKREVEVYEIEFLGNRKIGGEELLKNIKERVKKVRGDFRQKRIIKKWEEALGGFAKKPASKFLISKVKVRCSSGTYIRGIVEDLGKKMGFGAIAFSIKRTKVG